jgi:hypothetical protein
MSDKLIVQAFQPLIILLKWYHCVMFAFSVQRRDQLPVFWGIAQLHGRLHSLRSSIEFGNP